MTVVVPDSRGRSCRRRHRWVPWDSKVGTRTYKGRGGSPVSLEICLNFILLQ